MQKITTFNSRRLFNFDSYLFAIISFTHTLSLSLASCTQYPTYAHTHPLSKCSTLHTPNPSLSHTHSNQTHYLALSLSYFRSRDALIRSLYLKYNNTLSVCLFPTVFRFSCCRPTAVVVGAHSTILYP